MPDEDRKPAAFRALAVCASFNVTNRLADAFNFQVLSPEDFEAGARYLLKRGYR